MSPLETAIPVHRIGWQSVNTDRHAYDSSIGYLSENSAPYCKKTANRSNFGKKKVRTPLL